MVCGSHYCTPGESRYHPIERDLLGWGMVIREDQAVYSGVPGVNCDGGLQAFAGAAKEAQGGGHQQSTSGAHGSDYERSWDHLTPDISGWGGVV